MTAISPASADYCQWLPAVVELAREAGRRILEIYQRDFAIEHKADASPLTEADMAAHHVIVAGLEALTPGLPVLSEESKGIPFAERSLWHRYWLVDPLDGTREFINRNGQFTVNIALVEDHQAVLGVVLVPVGGKVYFACRDQGAFCQLSAEQPAIPIHSRQRSGNHVVVVGSRSHGSPEMQQFLNKLADYELISLGSALKSCLVAEGQADLYPRLGPTSEWDTAAAQCVVEEAGGIVTDTAMVPLRYNTKDSLLNPHFFVSGDPSQDWSRFLS